MANGGYYSRAERKRQILWHMTDSWERSRDDRWSVSRVANVLDMAKSQHLRLILVELEADGLIASQLEPFRGFPRRLYAPVIDDVKAALPGFGGSPGALREPPLSIKFNVGGEITEVFPEWR